MSGFASSTTPEAESEPPSAQQNQPPGPTRRSHRSCHLCNRRKVRCDKRDPCGPCSRAGKQCVFPPPGEPIRRPRKTTMADVASRISNLEQTLVSARKDSAGPVPPQPGGWPAASASPATVQSAVPAHLRTSAPDTPRTPESAAANGVLVQRGSTSQYFNEILLSRVIEEDQDIQSVFTSPDSRPSQPAVTSPFNPMGILSAPSLSHMPASFYPPKQAALRLWGIYLNYVENCCCLKIAHIPTMEIKIYSTIEDPAAAPLENLALSYAVFFATLISRGEEEVVVLLGGTRTAWLMQTKMGFEQALAHADFLDKPTMTGLHAMAIYLSALLVINRGKGNWILNGLAIRIAQSLGIQCNGERLGLSPFESEMRRRLWWHFVNRDGRSGEDYGLQSTLDHSQSPDIRLPLNVEDTDLFPEMTELPPERKSFTVMTFTLNQIDIANASYRLASLAATATPDSPPSEEVRLQIINEMKNRVNERLKYCNMVVPRHRHSMLISTYVMRKVDLITRQQWACLRCPGNRDAWATEDDLKEAVSTLEYGLKISTDELLKPFAWATKAYPQYHVLMYVIWHLCVRPTGGGVDEAWEIVDRVFEKQTWDNMREGFGLKSAVLDALYNKAKGIRDKTRVDGAAANPAPAVEEGVQMPTVDEGDAAISSSWPFGLGNAQGEGYEMLGEDGFPDWGSLVRGLQMDAQNFSDTLWR